MLWMIVIDVIRKDNDFHNYDDNADYHTRYSAFHDKSYPPWAALLPLPPLAGADSLNEMASLPILL